MNFQTFSDVLFANSCVDRDRTAIVCNDKEVTYTDLQARTSRVANALLKYGIGQGDRVALLLSNGVEFVEAFFGITAIGAIVVPLNTRLHPNEHVALLKDCRPKLLIAHQNYGTTVEALRAAGMSIDAVCVADGAALEGQIDYRDWTGAMPSTLPVVGVVSGSTPASILYTSGTTSAPKGVVLTHRNYLTDFEHVAVVSKANKHSVNLQLSPMYHAAAVHTFAHLAVGGTSLLNLRFDPEEVLRQIERYRVTYFFAVPTMLYQLMDHPSLATYDISSLRLISYGAAAITGARLEHAMRVFGTKLLHAYGMTETTSHASVLNPEDHLIAPGSIGRGLPGTQLRVVTKGGQRDVKPGEVGEIIVKGDHVMSCYWERPQETQEAVRDGWLYTGDLARVDSAGYAFIVDRKKDMVISGGVNIYPREAEEIFAKHPAVADVAVFGLPDSHWGESLMAVVVLRPSHTTSEQELLEFARSHLAGFKLPKRLEFLDALPKTATGKVQKTELRKQFSSNIP